MKLLNSCTCTITVSNLIGMCCRSARAFWARHHLTPEERANLSAGYTPPAVISASLGGGTHFL
uniref:Uncharacterized protein n=1 Tax=Rhodococcus hoagii TaxID=43767 RepID=B4F361_RHOHA|nr:hypothetical protein pVAPB_0570 [Prescottella equi]